MNCSFLDKKIASLCIDGKKIEIIPSKMEKASDGYYFYEGNLEIRLEFSYVAKNFYRWCVYLRNIGEEKTPQITDFFGIDLEFSLKDCAKWESIRGDYHDENSFMPLCEDFCNGKEIVQTAKSGMSSWGYSMPFFDVYDNEKALLFAIGWSGQWKYTLKKEGEKVTLQAGFEEFDLYLDKNEAVRSVSGALCIGESVLENRQYFRRVFREKLSPAAAFGGKLKLPLSNGTFDRYFYVDKEKYASVNEQKALIDISQKIGNFDTYWMDAAWFYDGFPGGVGNWSYAKGFPDTLLPVTRYAHEKNMKCVMWFEPERAYIGSEMTTKYMDKMLHSGKPDARVFVFNLADEDNFQWVLDKVLTRIEENEIDIYRQDFNSMRLMQYWQNNEKPGKKGYMENRYICNLYRLWDIIREKFPNILIDNCAGGGRRIDFETCMRSIVLWRSDSGCYNGEDEDKKYLWHQNHMAGMSRYIPFHGLGTSEPRAYCVRSCMSTSLNCNFDVLSPDFDFDKASLATAEYAKIREYFQEDFYPLTPATLSTDTWFAYQCAKKDSGICMLFRRSTCPENKKEFSLFAIDENAKYSVCLTDENYNKTEKILLGSEFSTFTAEIENHEESLLLHYKKI